MKKLSILKMLVTIVFLQSCSNKYNSESENLELSSNSFANSYGEQTSTEPRTDARLPITLPTTPAPGYPTPPNTQNPPTTGPLVPPSQPLSPPPQPAPTPVVAPAIATDCSEDLSALNWNDLNSREKVQIHLYTSDNDAISKTPIDNEVFAHDGIDVRFENPYRLGSQQYARFSPNLFVDGYTIKITDQASGASVTPVESDLDYHYQGGYLDRAVNTFVTGAKSAINDYNQVTNNSVRHLLNKNFYEKIKSFGKSTVSLYCKNNLVASGTQDVNSLTYIMSRKMYKKITQQGSYYSSPTADGFSHLDCPYEINAGANSKCNLVGNNIANGYWVINGQKGQQYNTSSYSYELNLSTLARGEHTVQFLLNYKNGSQDVSQIFLVKVK